ncbi:hypothetical protein A6A06_24970 [Streptomyces sp. CB02923]|uniref:hypothetical protein n=1 Tax=Streptomyces sp. CB02923 TaxID=1718985 RepID=UPI00093D479D|nr:hypothetical protein [Streptomyces sp. CB02923]OKH98875.1 hypothetical protein A6A06_24970 [Streptomyces sp. CB02923]
MNAQQLLDDMRPDIARSIESVEMVSRMRDGKAVPEQLQRLVTAEFCCQEAELATYPLLVAQHRHAVPAGYFGLVVHTVAKARALLGSVAQSVGLEPDSLSIPADARTTSAMRSMTLAGVLTEPGEAALYLYSDLCVWCAVFSELAEAGRRQEQVPNPLIEYMEWWGSEPSQEIVEGTLDVIAYGLQRGESSDRMLSFARQLPTAVAGYWEYVLDGE